MSLEAIATVSKAEEAAKQRKAEAAVRARALVKTAEEEGLKAVAAAAERAAAELDGIAGIAAENSRQAAEVFRKATEKEKDALRSAAEDRLDKAAECILERIVNG